MRESGSRDTPLTRLRTIHTGGALPWRGCEARWGRERGAGPFCPPRTCAASKEESGPRDEMSQPSLTNAPPPAPSILSPSALKISHTHAKQKTAHSNCTHAGARTIGGDGLCRPPSITRAPTRARARARSFLSHLGGLSHFAGGGTTRNPPPSPYTCVEWSVTLVSAISRLAKFMKRSWWPVPPSARSSGAGKHAAASNNGPACQVAGCSLMNTPDGMRKAVMSAAAGKRCVCERMREKDDMGNEDGERLREEKEREMPRPPPCLSLFWPHQQPPRVSLSRPKMPDVRESGPARPLLSFSFSSSFSSTLLVSSRRTPARLQSERPRPGTRAPTPRLRPLGTVTPGRGK